MEWLPPWLARAYAKIYAEKKKEQFEFSEASRILAIQEERSLAKTLTRLKTSGHLTVRRDPIDARRKLFNLVDPASTVLAFAIQSRASSSELIDKLRSATDSLQYYLNGPYAAYQYHHYSTPGSVDISVTADQLPVWIALLSGKDTSTSVNELPSERRSAVNVHLRTDFEPKLAEKETKLVEGVRYLSPELLIALGLAEGNPSLEDVLAVLVVQRKGLDWNKLLTLSRAYNTTRYLGFLIEVLNLESGKKLFDPKIIEKMAAGADLRVKLDFPMDKKKAEPQEEAYFAISSKWNLTSHVGRAVFSKIVTDLVRA